MIGQQRNAWCRFADLPDVWRVAPEEADVAAW